ncbi:MAG: acyl--CoA ligase, partial [Gammaproteobacteria bacterium]|nr:acyl--CoA ligase [Gammaproteobacteria bacterium]
MNITHLLARAASVFPDNPAVSQGGHVWANYAQLMRRIATMAAAFRERLGLVPGDRVALAMANCPQYLEVRYAAWYAGLAAVPMNAKLHAREFAYMLSDSGARLCFITPDLTDTVAPLTDELADLERVIEVGSAEYQMLQSGDPSLGMYPSEPDDVAWLFYTSGTTGQPKGVM